VDEHSYGGVVVRDGETVVIVPTRTGPRGERVLALPKGHADEGETPEQAAARELREETGVTGELVGELGRVTYWYQRKGRRIHKQVVFFLFDYLEGDVADHDHEVVEARWTPLEQAARELTFEGERQMAEMALSRTREGR
jgi:8-oxo-dGTP pyrophosphatase MutT (NUDIX family)